jgi:LCP family protein required for cell wall assembly
MAKIEKKLTREQIIRRRVLILASVCAVLLCLFAAWKLIVHKPSLPSPPPEDPAPGETQGTDPGASLAGDRKKDFFTFLIVGRDTGGGGNTDTIMVVAYDVANRTINILNVYRDTMVNVKWDIKRINSVYNVEGIDGLKSHIQSLLGFAPDFYVKVELDAFGQLVDAIGGVDFEIPYNMNYDDPTQDLHIHFEKGMQHLTGDEAMKVIRWRKNNDGSGVSVGDVGRVRIEQDFMAALFRQCLKIGNITKIGEFARIFNENVDSDLTVGEMIWFGQQAMGVSADNLQFFTLPGNYNGYAWSRTYQINQSYVLPDADGIVEMVNAYFNPYEENVTKDMLDIMSVNKDGSLSASGGELADPKAGEPPVKATAKPEESAPPEESAAPEEEPAVSPAPEESTAPVDSPAPEDSAQEASPEPTATAEPAAQANLLPARPQPVTGRTQ